VTRLISGLRSFALYWWGFIVGDDSRIAAGVVLALAGTAAIATTSVPAWWLLPIAVPALLAVSLWRATRARP
jgi:hypothetical protein